MGNSANRDARSIKYAERQRQTLEMRKAGATYEQIATALGYSDRSNARKDFINALEAIIEEPAKEVLAIEIARLDAMILGIWAKAKTGDTQAIDRVLRIMERRSAYLGLDSPKRQEHTGANGGPIAVRDLGSLSDEQLRHISEGNVALALAGASGIGAATSPEEPDRAETDE